MTREEAIRWLEIEKSIIKEVPEQPQGARELTEAYDMAISALQGGDAKMRNEDFRPSYMQETPSEDGSDLISRADALNALDRLCEKLEEEVQDAKENPQNYTDKFVEQTEEQVAGIAHAYHEVYDIPSADRPTDGEWLTEYDYDSWKRGYEQGKLWAKAEMEREASAYRPSGEWQKVNEQPYFRKHYHKVCCSVCHKQGSEKYNFCPNCGARMKGGAE